MYTTISLKLSNHSITWLKKHDIVNWNIGDSVVLINRLLIGQEKSLVYVYVSTFKSLLSAL